MFDIEDYLNENQSAGTNVIENEISAIEDEITDDLETIVSNVNSHLYATERFRQNKHSIDILYPVIEFPGNSSLIKTCNQTRFDLSTYPFEEDLWKISTIVLRPKHIEAEGTELTALYLPSRKILVHYLFIPHEYDISGSRLAGTDIFMPYDITTIGNQHSLGKTAGNSESTVSSLFYLISTISSKTDNSIDKFFYRIDRKTDSEILQTLDDISRHYYKFGY
ncbi:MAG: hypothetical protein JW982_13615 [Spirochaetes bacterium]|nr:hypothetical protein [Spirochaetota bacterium]